MPAGFVHHSSGLALRNATRLDTLRLLRLFADAISPWPMAGVRVWVRDSRGADYSGTCFDREGRIYVNLGPHVAYPYAIGTDVAVSISRRGYWIKPIYTIDLSDAYHLALFVFLHECYHWLVRQAGRNPRRKESMCDRFAARILVDRFGCVVRDERGVAADRSLWDIQDVNRFVRGAMMRPSLMRASGTRASAVASARAKRSH